MENGEQNTGHEGMDYDPYTGVWTPKTTKRKEKKSKTPTDTPKQPQPGYSISPRIKKWGLRLALGSAALLAAGFGTVYLDQQRGIISNYIGRNVQESEHTKKGQFWQGINDYERLEAQLEGKIPEKLSETKKEAYPDTRFLEEFPPTRTNEISIESDDPQYPLFKKAASRIELDCNQLTRDKNIVKYLVLREDRTFYERPGGIAWPGKHRVLLSYAQHKAHQLLSIIPDTRVRGASGIQEQLAKKVLEDIVKANGGEKTNTRKKHRSKLNELIYATELGLHNKDQVMCFYLNTVPLPGGTSGVEAGSQYLFGKSALDLTAAEALLTVVSIKTPALDPHNEEALKKHRTGALATVANLLEEKLITQADYDSIIEGLNTIQIKPKTPRQTTPFAGAIDVLIDEVETRYGVDLTYLIRDQSPASSLNIRTTIRSEDQLRLQQSVKRGLKHKTADIGAAVLDGKRRIVAIIARKDERGEVGGYNYAIHPTTIDVGLGSTFKPILYSYAYIIGIDPKSLWDDSKSGVKNWDQKVHGEMTLTEALATSNNGITSELWEEMFKNPAREASENDQEYANFMLYLEKLGFDTTTYKNEKRGGRISQSLALGVLGGITTLELGAAYLTLYDGNAQQPTIIEQIELNGQVYKIPPRPITYDIIPKKVRDAIKESLRMRGEEMGLPPEGLAKTGTNEDRNVRMELILDQLDSTRAVSLLAMNRDGSSLGNKQYAGTVLGGVVRAYSDQMVNDRTYKDEKERFRTRNCVPINLDTFEDEILGKRFNDIEDSTELTRRMNDFARELEECSGKQAGSLNWGKYITAAAITYQRSVSIYTDIGTKQQAKGALKTAKTLYDRVIKLGDEKLPYHLEAKSRLEVLEGQTE